MSRSARAAAFIVILPTLVAAQDQQPAPPAAPMTDEEQLLAAIRGRLDAAARNDLDAWARNVADDCIAPLTGAGVKQAWLKEHADWPREVKYTYGPLEDVAVRVHGDTAIVSYRAKETVDIAGQVTFQQTWQLETHVRQGKGWRLVAFADAVLPVEPTPAKADPKRYDKLVGKYEWAPNLISEITRDGDRLFEQYTGEDRVELLPEDDKTFFIKGGAATGDTTRYVFVTGKTGQATHYLYRTYGSTDRVVKRVN
jgi:ketosteroid isomerase-like protein